MFGLSGSIIRGISHGYSTGVLSSLEVVRKVRRWRISRFFRLKPTYSQLADVNTYGYSETLDDMKKNVRRYAKVVIRKWPGALAKKSWVCRTETRWAVEEALYFRKLIRRHKGKGLWMHEDGQVFAEKGRFKPSFFKPRKRLGFFARRFSRCADSKNVIGFIWKRGWALCRESKEYTGGNSCWPMNTKYPTGLNLGLERGDVCREIEGATETGRDFISSLSNREAKNNLLQSTWAERYYEERLEVTPEEVYQASVPYIRLIEAYSKRDYPVFIYGERGTGKGNLAQLLYSISLFADSPLYDIDMQLAGDNAVTFIRRLYEDDPDKKATFHFKNINKADTAFIKQIIDLNEELALSARAHIIASATIGWQENLSASCIEYIERLQCLTLKTRSLREHRADIPSLVNLYISTLNRRNGTETISMEDDGMKLLEAFDWNGNNDQLARVLKRLNAQCTNSLISASEVRNELMKEEELVKATSEAGLGNLIGTRTLKEIENSIVHMVLAEEDGNRTRTAKRLGLSRATLWRMLQEEEDNK